MSNKCKYGLKALLVLAHEAGRGPILVADLAAQEGLPRKFLETILLDGVGASHRWIPRTPKAWPSLAISAWAGGPPYHSEDSQTRELYY